MQMPHGRLLLIPPDQASQPWPLAAVLQQELPYGETHISPTHVVLLLVLPLGGLDRPHSRSTLLSA